MLHLYTDLGSKINQIQAMVPEYGKLWYDEKSIANIFSHISFVKKYRFSYDSHQDQSFTVNNDKGIIKFSKKKQRLYVFNTTYATSKSNVVTTVEENMVEFTSR